MILLMDGFLAIFVLFNILFPTCHFLGIPASKYCPMPSLYILLSIFLGPVYQWGLSQNFVPSFIAKLSPNNYHLVYYFGLKLALFIIWCFFAKSYFILPSEKSWANKEKVPRRACAFNQSSDCAAFALSFPLGSSFSWPVWEYLTKEPLPKRLSNTAKIISSRRFYDERHALEVLEALDILKKISEIILTGFWTKIL